MARRVSSTSCTVPPPRDQQAVCRSSHQSAGSRSWSHHLLNSMCAPCARHTSHLHPVAASKPRQTRLPWVAKAAPRRHPTTCRTPAPQRYLHRTAAHAASLPLWFRTLRHGWAALFSHSITCFRRGLATARLDRWSRLEQGPRQASRRHHATARLRSSSGCGAARRRGACTSSCRRAIDGT